MNPARRIVRTEKRQGPALYPYEIAWTEEGTWIIPDCPLGPWTDRVAGAHESIEIQRQTGGRITQDELHLATIGHARERGLRLPSETAALVRECEARLDVNSPASGTSRLADGQMASQLAEIARTALNWLNETVAPPGRRFVLEDALYLIDS